MTWTIRGAAGAVVLALGLGTGLAGVGAPANAAAGSPPVTQDDHVTLTAGGFAEVNVLANDSDPDGDQLAVCRLGRMPRGLDALDDPELGGGLGIISTGQVGTFTFTYYACDFQTLVPATVTVKVTPRPPMHVKVVKPYQHPGTIKVVNGSGFWVDFLWGDYKAEKEDGTVHVAPHSSRIVHTRRPSLVWVAVNERFFEASFGILRGIRLPEGVHALPPGAPPRGGSSSGTTGVTVVGRALDRTALRWALGATAR